MAFTTIQGSGANDATSFVGSSGVDTISIQNEASNIYVGSQASNDDVRFENFTDLVSGYSVFGGQGDDIIRQAGGTNVTGGYFNGNKNADDIDFNSITSTTVYGGQGTDAIDIAATATSSLINGNKFNDSITVASAAASSIYGGQGNDVLDLTTLNSTVAAGDKDNDDINLGGTMNGATVNGNEGNDSIDLAAGVTSFVGSSVFGGAGNDILTGTQAGDGLKLYGNNGTDQVLGSEEEDVIDGGLGADTLTDDLGTDTITGGGGADQFIKNDMVNANGAYTADTITDYSLAVGDTVGNFSVADLNGALGVTQVVEFANGGAAATVNGDAIVTAVATISAAEAVDDAAFAGVNVSLIAGDYANAAAVQTDWRANVTGTVTAGDAFLIAYDNGVNTTIASVLSVNAENNDVMDSVVVTDIVTLSGVANASTLTAASGAWLAFVA